MNIVMEPSAHIVSIIITRSFSLKKLQHHKLKEFNRSQLPEKN